jgi:cytochrome c-type biogenesis protein
MIFVLFGLVAGGLGGFMNEYRALATQIGGVFIVFFGAVLIGLRLPGWLAVPHAPAMPRWLHPGSLPTSFIIGVIFALGWTPCVGPVLATVLLLASTTATVLTGAFLLLVFSLGLTLPFILLALFYGQATSRVAYVSRYAEIMNKVGGACLILLGLLLLTENFGLLLQYGTAVFEWLGLEFLYNHL